MRWGCTAQLFQPSCPLGPVLETLPPRRRVCRKRKEEHLALGSWRCPWVPSCDPSAFSWIWSSKGTRVLTIIFDRWTLSPPSTHYCSASITRTLFLAFFYLPPLFLKIVFLFVYFYLFVYLSGSMLAQVADHIERSEDNLWESVLSFHYGIKL